jgi:cytochrome c oxidase assembly protein subunit 11
MTPEKNNQAKNTNLENKNRRVGLAAAGLVAGMVGLAYASVPLYALFCKVTGFGGTTQTASAAPGATGEATVSIRFDANISSELDWRFQPSQQTQTVKVGEQTLAHYEAVNNSSETITGTAVFNVTPAEAGAYFNKIECFCFVQQTLKPGQRIDMPVSYFIDPEFLKDADTRGIREITLSYTFYPAKSAAPAKQAKLQGN